MRHYFGFLWLSLALTPFRSLSADELPPILPLKSASPQVDGHIGREEWKDALYLGEIPSPANAAPMPKTEAWLKLTPTHLHLAVRSEEPRPEKMLTQTLADEIKGEVWRDDSVELLIDPYHLGKTIYRLAVNSEGTLFDSAIVQLREARDGWTSNAIARTHVGKDYWEAEVTIPLASLGHHFSRGELFSLNVGRNRYAGGSLQTASYAGRIFVAPQQFVSVLAGGAIEADGFRLISVRRGPFQPETNRAWDFRILSGKVSEESFIFPRGGKAKGIRIGQRFISVPIQPGEAEEKSELAVMEKDRAVFKSGYAVRPEVVPQRIEATTRPLFEPLMEDYPEGFAREGVFLWAHELMRDSMRKLPFRTGMEYSHTETPYRAHQQDHGMMLATLGILLRNPQWLERSAAFDVPWVVYLKNSSPPEVPRFKPAGVKKAAWPWLLDPRMREHDLRNAEALNELNRKHPVVRWVLAGDETWEHMHVALTQALDRKDEYPELQEVDREIREKYGFGKYGLPESAADPNPYRWIATHRWEIDRMLEQARKIQKVIRSETPEMKFISWDCMTGHRPYGVSRWGEVFDVVTAQIYPSQSKGRDHVGFTTKFYADLIGGSAEFWPLIHFEHFPASFTAPEVEEIFSRSFRAGATGLHCYAADYRNENVFHKGSSVVDRIGAPERWNVFRSLASRLQKPFRVKQPTPEIAVFYSNTSYQGTGVPRTFHDNNQCEWIYTLLGPRLGTAFRFVDDISIPAKPESLKAYKAVYIPYMPIADDAEYAALEAYVKDGGTLIVCDPLAFQHRSDGTERPMEGLRAPLKSLEAGPGGEILRTVANASGKPIPLPSLGPRYPLEVTGGAVLAESEGRGVVVEQTLGKGKVIFFAENPLVPAVITHAGWIDLFNALNQRLGIQGGHDVWRFRFPSTPQPEQPRPAGVCLTGNYFEWSLSEIRRKHNASVDGTYELANVSTGGKEPPGEPIAFQQGRLTDRWKGAAAPNDAPVKDFVLDCQADGDWSVTFRFEQPVAPGLLRIFFGGTLPAGKCEISSDGQSWQPAGGWEERKLADKNDVSRQTVTLPGGTAQWVRLSLSATPAAFRLVEVDIWGEESEIGQKPAVGTGGEVGRKSGVEG